MNTGLSVDIVVNNFNYGRFVGQAVDSALAQTLANVNVIVVDDGSTDDSREILQAYGSRIELVMQENGGQAAALNAGFARSSGDVVMFLDADDLLRPGAAALVASRFASDSRLVKIQYGMEVIDEDGRPTGAVKPRPGLPLPDGDVKQSELVFPFDLVWAATSGNAFRAETLRRIMPIPERDFDACADWYLVHLTPLLGPIASLTEILACYRVHDGNRYEPRSVTLDLDHIRQTVAYAAVTARAIEQLAGTLGLGRPYKRMLSVSDLANRLVSLRLAPDLHPIPGDRRRHLAVDGMRAAARRFDVSFPLKILYAGWFAAMCVAPSRPARQLAELLLFPQRRGALNLVLERFYR